MVQGQSAEGIDLLPGLGQPELAPLALHQRQAVAVVEGAQAFGDGGLADVQGPGGLFHSAELDYGAQGCKTPEIGEFLIFHPGMLLDGDSFEHIHDAGHDGRKQSTDSG